MNDERHYAAVHMGDGSVSVLVSLEGRAREGEFRAALSMRAGTLQYLDLSDGGYGEPVSRSEGHTITVSDHIDDREVLVGSTVVEVEHAIGGTVASALTEMGVSAPVDLLEIACPSAWGPSRRHAVRRAVGALAREVVVVDTATAAIHSVGERAPDFGVVVDIGELESTVSALVREPEGVSGRVGADYSRSGKWEAVGWRDTSLPASVQNRVAECLATDHRRGVVDVFVVDTTVGRESSTDLVDPADPRFRVRRSSGMDVVRALAVRAGFSTSDHGSSGPVGWTETADASDSVAPVALSSDSSPDPVTPPLARAAPWLADVHSEPEPSRSTRLVLVGVAAAVVLAVGAALFGVHVVEGTSRSVAAAEPTVASSASDSVTTTVRTSDVTTSDPPPPKTPKPERVPFGRLDFELPSLWTARPEPERVILVPPDLPERRIVLAAIELSPDVTFDVVADELTAQFDSRGEDSTIGNLTRATDFGGRIGLTYDESPGDGSIVRWRVFVDDGLQVSVGCQTLDETEPSLDADCAHVASSIEVSASR